MQNNRDNVFKSSRKKPTVKLQQKSRQHAKEIAKNTATELQKIAKCDRIFLQSTAVFFAISFAGCRHFSAVQLWTFSAGVYAISPQKLRKHRRLHAE